MTETFVAALLTAPCGERLLHLCRSFRSGDPHVDDGFPAACVKAAEHNTGATYLMLRCEDDAVTGVVGYASLAYSHIALTSRERRDVGKPPYRQLGAIRIGMIGIDHRYQRRGIGTQLLAAATGVALSASEVIPARFLVADVNPAAESFYRANGWVDNASEAEAERGRSSGTLSMRFDLHG